MIPIRHSHLRRAGLTHPGMTGKNNEDSYLIQPFQLSEKDKTPALLAVVADGIGGKLAGEVASQLMVDILKGALTGSTADEPIPTLMQALYDANTEIQQRAFENTNQSGMGTTVTAAWIIDRRLYVAHAGNSRLYLLRDGVLRQLTIDHTWVQEAINHGIIDKEKARTHPNSHIITRYIGAETMIPDMRIQLNDETDDALMEANQGMMLSSRDILFLCSDGLSDLIFDNEIQDIIEKNTIDKALEKLTDLACARGGHDNITSIILQVPSEVHAAATERTMPDEADKKLLKQVVVGILILGLLTAAAVAYLWYF